MLNKIKILAIGDVVGKGARKALINNIEKLKEKYQPDLIIVNAENTTHGSGLSYKHYLQYVNSKIDVLTMGNHTFGREEINEYISNADRLIIPANFTELPSQFDSHKEYVFEFKGKKIKIINLLGDHGINIENKENCFKFFDKIYDAEYIYIVDFHADITAEKNVFGYYVDGRASLVYGTHTHVQTADERILPQGTAFISDVGMCGSRDSVIGYDYNSFVERMKKGSMTSIALTKPLMLNAILAEIDLDSKKAISISRINENME